MKNYGTLATFKLTIYIYVVTFNEVILQTLKI